MIVVDANLMVVSAVKDDRRRLVFQQLESLGVAGD